MGTKRKSPLKEMIDESLAKLQNSGFAQDPALEDDREISGPERFAKGQKAKDEFIIDSQLADIVGKEGYFLKLKKELRPGLGEWMLMKTIETEWRQWADTETEVARIVKEHTKTAPIKWGTGPYRIEYACRGGMRGKTYPPKDFYINAEEEFLNQNNLGVNGGQPVVDAATQVTTQLDMLGKLLDVTRGFQPAPIDPSKTQDQIASAFEKGLQIKAGEGNNSSALMATMMTGLIGMMTAVITGKKEEPKVISPTEGLTGMLTVMKDFGVLGGGEKEKPKSFTETLVELKAIGLDIFKKDDPMEQMSKLKQLANIAGELMGLGGTGEKPGILEKIVDMVGPAIPGMIKDLKDTAVNAAQVQIEAGKNIERAKLPVQTTHEGQSMNMAPQTMNVPPTPQNNAQVQAFFNGLHESVKANNRMFYPIIYTSLLQEGQGVALVNGIVAGTHTAKELIELLQGYGDQRFKDSEFVMKHLVSYTNGFIIWLRDMVKPKTFEQVVQENPPVNNGSAVPKGPGFEVGCTLCSTVFVYEDMEEFMAEETKVCGNNGCVGALQPLTKAS
jgi:hypothetical protein